MRVGMIVGLLVMGASVALMGCVGDVPDSTGDVVSAGEPLSSDEASGGADDSDGDDGDAEDDPSDPGGQNQGNDPVTNTWSPSLGEDCSDKPPPEPWMIRSAGISSPNGSGQHDSKK